MREIITEALEESARIKKAAAQDLTDAIAGAATIILEAYRNGHKLLLAGNGGSAADAQHIATELVGRFMKERKAMPAISLSTDTSILTATANDYGYENVFSRQIEALGKEGDILLALTTSGASPSILKAIDTARTRGMRVIILTGEKGKSLGSKGDQVIVVPSEKPPRIQETHITIGHILCQLIEDYLCEGPGSISG
jgi:D-sedoheptulose 7-phosphate isomerase